MKLVAFPRRIGPLSIVALCLFGSGTIRLGYSSYALGNEVAAATAAEMGAELLPTSPAECAANQAPAEVLAAIQTRLEKLKQQELELAERSQILAAVELKTGEQLAILTEAEAKLSATLALADAAAENDLVRLTAVYENMKPKSAADIFAAMDIGFAAGFLARMRPDAAAEIMAGLPTDRAYAISVRIAGRNADAPVE